MTIRWKISPPKVPVVCTDARERERTKEALITVTRLALERLRGAA